MSLTLRGSTVASLTLVVALALGFLGVAPARAGTPPDPRPTDPQSTHPQPAAPHHAIPRPTGPQARAALARAERRLRPDTVRVRAGRTVGHGPSTEITTTLRDLQRARSALTGPDRRAADALLARPGDPADDLVGDSVGDGAGDRAGVGATDVPRVTYGDAGRGHYCPTGGVACVHWATSGPEALPATELAADADADGVPDYVETVYTEARRVWSRETGGLGYRAPLPDGGTAGDADDPDGRLDLYLADLGRRGLYGYCAPEGTLMVSRLPGYCVLDNDYAPTQYAAASYLDPLRVTVAHELFHAVQFAYDVDEDHWFMEGTATWVEGQVFGALHDNHQYLPTSPIVRPDLPVDYTPGFFQYGAFLFFTYVSERLGPDVVRRAWELAEAGSTDRYSLQAVRAAVQARTAWSPFMATFAAWNTLPPGSYRARASYPAPTYLWNGVLSSAHPSTGWRRAARAHLSSAAVRLVPAARGRAGRRLVIDVDAPDTSHGSAALVQRRLRSGDVRTTVLPLSLTGRGRTVVPFDRRVVSSVVVVVANTSTAMRDCGYIGVGPDSDQPEYSCAGRGVYDAGQTFLVRARLG